MGWDDTDKKPRRDFEKPAVQRTPREMLDAAIEELKKMRRKLRGESSES
jgi:hypothetical protein